MAGTDPFGRDGSSSGGSSSGGSDPFGRGSGKGAPAKKSGGGGLLHSIEKYSGAQFVGNLGKDIGRTAVGAGPGIYHAAKTTVIDPWAGLLHGHNTFNPKSKESKAIGHLGGQVEKQYRDYYGHNLAHNFYTHPVQGILDATAVLSGGLSLAAKAGKAAADAGAISDTSRLAKLGDRATIQTRSPRKIATGKGPAHEDITSTRPIVKLREQAAARNRSRPGRVEKRGGELQRYGKQIQANANQGALQRLQHFEPYHKATKGLSPNEWAALHIRAMDIHPDDLAELWRGKPAERLVTDGRIRNLVLKPSKRMVRAEPELRSLSKAGERLYKQHNLLKDETASARPDLTKRQASEMLGRPVREIHGDPYYFPHTVEQTGNVSPLVASGGGKAVPRKLGSTKQNTGALALSGKLHLRSDVLGPEFLRRVKYVKYDEIHNALRRGAVRITRQQLEDQHGGRLPKGWEYLRKSSTRIPPTIRGEGETGTPIHELIPNAEDLHDSKLAQGFSTTDAAEAHTSGEHYYIVPKTTVKAATGEFTRTNGFVHAFNKYPLSVWRSAVLGLRVGFLTNNFIGNSVMYGTKTGGAGALRDLFMAIKESHGQQVAKKILDDPATPPKLRGDLYKEFFPEQIHGTFGHTQSPSTSTLHAAGSAGAEAYRKVTGALPKLTSKIAEETPRRALIRHYIRKSPEFKRVYEQLPVQTRNFQTAARRVLQGEGPRYQRYISKQVNYALGDYMHLSPFERNVMRNAFPFYSWYRAIVTTTYHLAVDTPGRAAALAAISRIGADQSDKQLGEVPSFLKGSIPIGDGPNGTKRVVSTQGLNPYATLEQMGRGISQDYTSLGVNPFVEGPAQYLQRHSGNISPLALALSPLKDLVQNLPPSRLLAPPGPSHLYPTRKGRRPQLSGYLGVPVKEYDPNVAAQQARQGR